MKSGGEKNCVFYCCLLMLLMMGCREVSAQKKWDGGGGDGLWSTAANWNDDILPSVSDVVILDNAFLSGNYTVSLPSGNISVSVQSIQILPATASIRLVLPATNTAIPALSVSGGGIEINSGAVFINSSGASSGTAIAISDSLRIFNGGRFIQNSRNAHAAYITRLSRAVGTEKGVFEFDVPGTASYTIALAGRTYGCFELKALAAGGNKTYLSNGATNAVVNGDFIIGGGVSYALDYTGELLIKGSLLNSGNFNLASAANNNSIKLWNHLICTGTITESSGGLPVLELAGNTIQDLNVSGTIGNSVSIKVNNPAGVILQTTVSVPFRLIMQQGKITSSDSALLVLQSDATITADSTVLNCFVNGPLKKQGLQNTPHFLFPVGKGITQRWMALKNASGDCTVEFIKSSPYELSSSRGTGIDHLSRIEYWSVITTSPVNPKIELSFDNVNSGGVTDLSSLRVSQLINGVWVDAGNSATTGSAGSSGSVVSNDITDLTSTETFLTLAGTTAAQNPLPDTEPALVISRTRQGFALLKWRISSNTTVDFTEVEFAETGRAFKTIARITGHNDRREYSFEDKRIYGISGAYRIKLITSSRQPVYSAVRWFDARMPVRLQSVYAGSQTLIVVAEAFRAAEMDWVLTDSQGCLIKKIRSVLRPGIQQISLSFNALPAGYYQVFGLSSGFHTNTFRFFQP